MSKYAPSSFNRPTVRAGLLKAMGFGEPNSMADKVTFYFPTRATTTESADQDGVPFDPSVRVEDQSPTSKAVSCALEFIDWQGQVVEPGSVKPTRIRLTLLQEEWAQVKDFTYVTAGGANERYARDYVQPTIALGSIDVVQVLCRAQDES
ncbi:hypothetical protein GCM10028801_30740 [Nocardioides maradonensis]